MPRVHSLSRLRLALLAALLIVGLAPRLIAAPAAAAPAPSGVDLLPVAAGLQQPVGIVDAGDGSGRLFVVERQGRVRIVRDGQALAEPFLDLSGAVSDTTWEQGLFSIAFDPDYARSGVFYVTSSPTPDEWRLTRFHVSSNPDRADPASATIILSIPHPADTHYAGGLAFGPDGYLWISVGDGGGAFDPWGNAQDLGALLGKLLRIDVRDSSLAGDQPYAIPADNPFVNTPDARPEIWAYGLRNPWRFSFDRATGDLYIGDVGQGDWEEVDVQPAGSPGGQNYGWPLMEGLQCSSAVPDCDPGRYVPPVIQIDHSHGCAVTGGFVYRAERASPLWGAYLHADFCSGTLRTLQRDAGDYWRLETALRTPLSVSSFGQDSAGQVYVADFTGGGIYRVVSVDGAARPTALRAVPASIPTGGVQCALQVRGWNFAPDAQVLLDGVARATTWRDSSWLTAPLTADDLARPGWTQLTVRNGDGQVSEPSALTIVGDAATGAAVHERWEREDEPVASGVASRTWLWGPSGLTCPLLEEYADAPGGVRYVQYFDKSRMEVTDPSGDAGSLWHVTNGLLAKELITGQLQLGDDLFEQRAPANVPVAGDFDDPRAPTYATFGVLLDRPAAPLGAALTQRVTTAGSVRDDPALARRAVTAAEVDPVTRHAIASPFWAYMTSAGIVNEDGQYVSEPLFENPLYATGRPLTEAYWARVTVDGTPKDVLAQCFERRCLTYTPDNPPAWQVEAGNIGQHYYWWRYGHAPGS